MLLVHIYRIIVNKKTDMNLIWVIVIPARSWSIMCGYCRIPDFVAVSHSQPRNHPQTVVWK
jgi:hypothetical protein